MKHKTYPELQQLFSCYLDEDWHYEHSTPDAALTAGIAGLPPDVLQQACEEMDRLRADPRDTETLANMIRGDLGACYLWEVDGYTLDTWLTHVADMLNQRCNAVNPDRGAKVGSR